MWPTEEKTQRYKTRATKNPNIQNENAMNSELQGMHIHLVDYFLVLTPSDDLHLGQEDDKGVGEVGDAACGVGRLSD